MLESAPDSVKSTKGRNALWCLLTTQARYKAFVSQNDSLLNIAANYFDNTKDITRKSDSRIELRSEKVRHLIGEIPPTLVRWGIIIYCVIVIAIVAVTIIVPYPHGNGESILQHVINDFSK